MKKNKTVKIVNKSNNELPEYSTEGSAGLDLRAFLCEPVTIPPMERRLIPTGIHIQLPQNHEAQIRPRSGLAVKHGITVLNTPGTIDFDFIGEIKIVLINLSNQSYTIKNGDRIAQMVVNKFEKIELRGVENLDETIRGEGGFGHTGTN